MPHSPIRPILETYFGEGAGHGITSIQSVVKSLTGEDLKPLEALYILDFYLTSTTMEQQAQMEGKWAEIIEWVLLNMDSRPKSAARRNR